MGGKEYVLKVDGKLLMRNPPCFGYLYLVTKCSILYIYNVTLMIEFVKIVDYTPFKLIKVN